MSGDGVPAPVAEAPRLAPRRRWWRWGRWVGAVLLLHPVLWLCGMPPALPFDWLLNVGGVSVDRDLMPPEDGRRRLVVLQHGLWRSAWSLWRLERALRAHGYDVLNPGYPSTDCTLEEAADLLAAELHAKEQRDGPPDELMFCAHSMGGLVVEEFLRRHPDRAPARCVYVAVPHRGAVLADLRSNWWPFRLFLGSGAAMQLSPGDPFHRQPLPWPERSGAIVGDVGAGNAAIPGDDDGTVAVGEARMPGAADVVVLDVGHTWIPGDRSTIRQALQFLRHGRFGH